MKRWTNFQGLMLATLTFTVILCIQGLAGASEIVTGDSPVLQRIVKDGVIKVGFNPLFKPFSFTNKKDERIGIDIDIAELLAKNMGVKLEKVVPNSFTELFSMAQSGQIDVIMAAMSRNFERAGKVDFTDSYYDTGITIMLNKIRANKLKVGQVKSYGELMEKLRKLGKEDQLIIAATTGKGSLRSVPKFFPQAKIQEYPTNEKSAEAAANGETHIMVHDEIFLNTWAQDNPDKTLYKMIVFPEPYKPDTYGFAIAKGNQSFLNMLNMFIADKLRGQGYFENFMRKYMKK
ncbi:transporter substrate-binding domain-containing protein [Desulfococcaceae bacterium HSG8]|nr:transporter substrate-binding domain-containing protein [Desulfococcaceae bacterium HSG8]